MLNYPWKKIALIMLMFSPDSLLAQSEKFPDSVPGEFLVKLKQPAQSLRQLSHELGGEIVRKIALQNVYILKRPIIEQPAFAISSLKQNQNVIEAEPNFYYRADKYPADKNFDLLWGLRNFGQSDSKQIGIAGIDIGVEKAWDHTTGSTSVVVAVIDTGIDLSHPDLKSNIWRNEGEINGKPGIDDDGNGYVDDFYGMNFSDAANPSNNPNDDNGHGSHCAGTIGAYGDDQGVVGVNWNVRLMPVKFLSGSGSGTLEGAIRSIDYAVQMGAKVLSNSWGGGGSSQLLKEAIERAEKSGALFVAAAGNDGMNNDSTPHYPSSYEVGNVLSVAAINNRGEIASFSNVGKKSVSVAAPGVNILSTYKNGGYETLSGTSMATPHVSGVAALLLSQSSKLSYQEIKERIIQTVQKYPGLRSRVVAGGIVNAENALLNTQPPPDPNDPFYWAEKKINLGNSLHPYKPNTSETFEIEVPEAKEFSIYFDRFETENGYDKVSFYDRSGALLFEMMGLKDETHSPIIIGQYIKIVFTTDTSVEKFGFESSKINYR